MSALSLKMQACLGGCQNVHHQWEGPPASHQLCSWPFHLATVAQCRVLLACSSALRRNGFKHVVASALEVCDAIESAGAGRAVDIDNLMVREAMDVIGKVGFNHDFKAVQVRAYLLV